MVILYIIGVVSVIFIIIGAISVDEGRQRIDHHVFIHRCSEIRRKYDSIFAVHLPAVYICAEGSKLGNNAIMAGSLLVILGALGIIGVIFALLF